MIVAMLIFILCIFSSISLFAQNAAYPILTGATLPLTCPLNSLFFRIGTPGGLYLCDAVNHWSPTAFVASGQITMILSGSCPFGFSEVAALNGKTVIGTISANGNVGTLGGNDNITPVGTVTAPVFSGSALVDHAHELPWQIPSATTIRQIAVATFGAGISRAATAVSAAGTANTTSAAVALSQRVSAGTPVGTNSVPIFSGTSFDNRSAFVRVIFCSKD